MEKPHPLHTGAVTYELSKAGDEVVIRSAKFPDVLVAIPIRTMEAFGLRKLRDGALQPEKAA